MAGSSVINGVLAPYLANRRALILGFGQEGQSTFRYLRRHFPDVRLTVADADPQKDKRIAELADGNDVDCILGDGYLDEIHRFDTIFKTPGLSLKSFDLNALRPKIVSQTQIALEACGRRMIGVTGTKGKSTTATLIAHLLKTANVNCLLMGNMGTPFFDIADQIGEETVVVNELSSHQLEFVTASPRDAVLLNIFEEHLDHYVSYGAYQDAKFNIARFQTAADRFYFSAQNEAISEYLTHFSPKGKIFRFSDQRDNASSEITVGDEWISCLGQNILPANAQRLLAGRHNLLNIALSASIAKQYGANYEAIAEGVRSFKGLPHRLEFVGEFGGIKFVNDSIATIPEAAIQAIESFDRVDTLILGGFDRGVDYGAFIAYLRSAPIANLIFMPVTGFSIAEKLGAPRAGQTFCRAQTLDEAVLLAKKHTPDGGLVLLSPAAASYGAFKNFEERGRRFAELAAIIN